MKTDLPEKRGVHYGFVIVACCCLMMGVNVGLTFSCAGIFYRPVSESLGIAVGEFGIYMSIMYVTSALMLPLAGNMLEKHSARWLFTLSSALMGLTFVGMGLADRVWEFYLAGGVLGVTLAFLLYLSFPTLVNRWFRAKVGLMIGICSAASGIGGMIFNPIAGVMITDWGWRWAYGMFGIIILLIVSPLLLLLLRDRPEEKGLLPYGAEAEELIGRPGAEQDSQPEIHKEEAAGTKQTRVAETSGMTYSQALRSPLFYLLILFAFIMMGTSTLNLFIPGYVTDLSFSIEQASLAAAFVMAGVTVGKLVLGWINDRDSRVGVGVTTLFGMTGLGVLLVGAGSFALVLVGAFLFGWAYAGVTVQTAMLTRSVFGPRDYARIYSNISIALAAGGAVASGGWGLLADATSDRFIFAGGVVCLGVCLLIGLWSLRKRRQSGENC